MGRLELLKIINTFVKEYEVSFKKYKGDTPEILNEKINKINLRVKAFQDAHSKSVGLFQSTKEDSSQTKLNTDLSDKKASSTSSNHINGVTSQTIVSGSPTKKSS